MHSIIKYKSNIIFRKIKHNKNYYLYGKIRKIYIIS